MTESATPQLPPHRKVHVDLGTRAYDVLIGRRLLERLGEEMERDPLRLTGYPVVISDSNLPRHFLALVSDSIRYASPKQAGRLLTDYGYGLTPLSPGESTKSLEVYSALLSDLAKDRVPRTGVIIALGGGVIGDLAGFVAAMYLRGIARPSPRPLSWPWWIALWVARRA